MLFKSCYHPKVCSQDAGIYRGGRARFPDFRGCNKRLTQASDGQKKLPDEKKEVDEQKKEDGGEEKKGSKEKTEKKDE
ncbi:unnamed protein product [Caenorhabditis sp. 36 PRJEB53466]|nr:unnamed protein product [Caenorhabditis sp. 36 PRJEB53466]